MGGPIRAASLDPNNLSWCTCSEEICKEQLGGKVAWNLNGAGWSGCSPDNVRVEEVWRGEGFREDVLARGMGGAGSAAGGSGRSDGGDGGREL